MTADACLRGLADGRPVESVEAISCVEGVSGADEAESFATLPDLRFVVSNTTEAGIEYRKGENTFPAKVARLLRAQARKPGRREGGFAAWGRAARSEAEVRFAAFARR